MRSPLRCSEVNVSSLMLRAADCGGVYHLPRWSGV